MANEFSFNETENNYAVFGHPVKHSKSPLIHQLFAEQCGLKLCYQAIEVPINSFSQSVENFFSQGGFGLNITVPFKEEAFALCDSLTAHAQRAASVNTLWFENNKIHGDTTDGQGLINDLTLNHQLTLKNKSILILGAGASVKAILKPLLALDP